MAKRRKTPNLKRRVEQRQPKRKFILVCEGAKTERDYFSALKTAHSGAIIDIEIIPGVGVPKTVVDRALEELKKLKGRKLDSFEEKDEVWAVFDRDNHPHYKESMQRGEDGGVQIARSNPCFELWLILHIQDYDKACDHRQIQNDLGRIRPEYHSKNHKTVDCAEFMPQVEVAEGRANSQLENRIAEGDPYGPPSTTVGRLTSQIRSASRKFGK